MTDENREDLPSIEDLTYNAAVARMGDVADEIKRVASKKSPTDTDREYLGDLEAEFNKLDSHIDAMDRKALVDRVDVRTGRKARVEEISDDPMRDLAAAGKSPNFHNPWDLSEIRELLPPDAKAVEYRSRALSAIESLPGATDRVRKTMTEFIERHDTLDSKLAKQLLLTSSPEYMRAFSKVMHTQGHANFTPEEARAMSLTANAGGYLVPFQLDPAVIITSDGTFNQVRQFARNVVATGNVWHGVSTTFPTWSVDAEAAEVSDDATTFAQPSVTIYKIASYIPISIEALEDEQNVTSEIGRLLAGGKDQLEMQLFTTGSGSSQHTGIVGTAGLAALTAASSVITSITADTFGLADVYATDTALPARYRPNAGWLMHRYTANAIRQFDTAGGAGLWQRLPEGMWPQLLGKPVFEAESMDGAITAAAENYLLVYGDRDAFVVADRIGTTVEFIPTVFSNTTTRPSGQRGFYAYSRSGSNIVNAGGLSVLNVT